MVHQILSPRVQHAEKADASTEVNGVGGYLQKRFSARAEQQIVQYLLVLQHQAGEVMREREDEVEVRNLCSREHKCLWTNPLRGSRVV